MPNLFIVNLERKKKKEEKEGRKKKKKKRKEEEESTLNAYLHHYRTVFHYSQVLPWFPAQCT